MRLPGPQFTFLFWNSAGIFPDIRGPLCPLTCDHCNVRLLITFAFCLLTLPDGDSRLPPEVAHKSGYVNPGGSPPGFSSAMLWGIGIADTRVPGYERAAIEIARMRLACRVNGEDIVLNDDRGKLRGGLYSRSPWFKTDAHDPIPLAYSTDRKTVVLRVGERPDRVWHFWAGSPRVSIPRGHLEGCTVHVRAKISKGALLQVGFDYWRNSNIDYGSGGNNHEAGASRWYFPSGHWQEATFSDIREK